ncbi:hypothetical protein [Candidatus Contubernalis alkaliaceticus]|uniref:hypothetical protein n=1 Tax=Candidatus Contubernalis alkaliaceticus TaxID=338645 RepID=UPI001F4BF2FE|nr:hypothetical protein [Candidatus Contubernalis alkalaceticus]UNC92731.1 hypothetical protein HUE98_11860 [Candidatus Contubernalis alkalaceticus]
MIKEAKLVFTPQLARHLLKNGYQIIDIKPDRKKMHDTVFVFRFDDGILEEIKNFKLKTA